MNRLDSYSPLGYSLAGVVLEVGRGRGVHGRPACGVRRERARSPCEINWCDQSLRAVPDGVSPSWRVRHRGLDRPAGSSPGERTDRDTACVIGLGLVGQLVVQLLWPRVRWSDSIPTRTVPAGGEGGALCAPHQPTRASPQPSGHWPGLGWPGADRIFLVSVAPPTSPWSWPPARTRSATWWTSESAA